MRKTHLFFFLFGLSLLFALPVVGQTDVTDDDVNRVAQELFCPTCESVPVDVCPTEVCADWRGEIRLQLEAGSPDEEILDYFSTRYGTGVLANPPAKGLGNFFWIGPIVVVILGLFIFGRQMQKLQTVAANKEDLAKAPKSTGDPYRDRLEEELNR
ncbi:MAG: cytochrome c-type biogenesis protein CcmH [Cellvibrionaceae bacterium]|jgi:cytochrome c-type biogenesis protein CcmH